ncbi:class I SAM-dependent methyltransferase [Paenibacillus sp. 1001270B_150601_E10]|uniref:class I SAM-dependent methyltransferase n=1 Tax=Paenibacillus sp. 1001270B_150601_E10 TaxID=2787079 RepID=UPI00189F26ED|nr:class I SAM-dependent methyltransferase [Paenibacillus sp. 1001270B_150601_E10]
MGFLSVLGYAQQIVKDRVQPGDKMIDATMGTGVDTLFLAGLMGKKGEVAAFDIQEAALHMTKQRLAGALREEQLKRCHLLLHSHADMIAALPDSWQGHTAAIMFNLGFLPTAEADKSIITETSVTIQAMEQAMQLLRPRGVLSLVLYPGHDGGDREAAAVEAWASSLPSSTAQAVIYRMIQRPHAPYVIGIEKR